MFLKSDIKMASCDIPNMSSHMLQRGKIDPSPHAIVPVVIIYT